MIELGGTKFRPGAFMASLTLHLLLMLAFTMIQFSRGVFLSSPGDSPQGKILALEAIEQMGIVVPKPSVKDRGYGGGADGGLYVSKEGLGISQGGQFGGSRAANSAATAAVGIAGEVFSRIADQETQTKSNTVSFFGNVASSRKVCFVVDCSGSMLGFFGQVRDNLIASINELSHDNFFGITVFRGQEILEFQPGALVRAGNDAKARAGEFVNSIATPTGRPDALEAMKKAIQYKDSIGDSPGVVYFLTDGFDYDNFADVVEQYRKEYAPVIKIHTIGFMVNKKDADMLRLMAARSGGKFTLYSGGVN